MNRFLAIALLVVVLIDVVVTLPVAIEALAAARVLGF